MSFSQIEFICIVLVIESSLSWMQPPWREMACFRLRKYKFNSALLTNTHA